MVNYEIILSSGDSVSFTGKYRRDLETKNWHYYEKEDGVLVHFRKQHMMAVIGDNEESVLSNRA